MVEKNDTCVWNWTLRTKMLVMGGACLPMAVALGPVLDPVHIITEGMQRAASCLHKWGLCKKTQIAHSETGYTPPPHTHTPCGACAPVHTTPLILNTQPQYLRQQLSRAVTSSLWSPYQTNQSAIWQVATRQNDSICASLVFSSYRHHSLPYQLPSNLLVVVRRFGVGHVCILPLSSHQSPTVRDNTIYGTWLWSLAITHFDHMPCTDHACSCVGVGLHQCWHAMAEWAVIMIDWVSTLAHPLCSVGAASELPLTWAALVIVTAACIQKFIGTSHTLKQC